MISVKRLMLFSAIAVVVAGCASPKLNTGGEKIRILDPNEVSSCRKLGKTNASVVATVAGIDRPAESMEAELETLSRNSASKMGGDTIVALTVIENGQRTYEVYKCIDPNG